MESVAQTRKNDKAVQAAINLVKHGPAPDVDDLEPIPPPDFDTAPDTPEAAPDAPEAQPSGPMGQHLPDTWLTDALPVREFVFKGAFPTDAVALLTACGGSGKSFLSLEFAASLATGRALLPGLEPVGGPGRVALLALEDDILEVQRRLQRIGAAFNLGFDDRDALAVAHNVRLFCLPTFSAVGVAPDGTVTASADLRRLSAELAEFAPKLIVADPLAGLLGGCEENDNSHAQAVIGILRAALPPGAALLVCAHTSKSERLTSTTARGASAWMDSARQVIALRPADDKEARTLGEDMARRTVVLQVTKSNYSGIGAPLYLQRCQEPAFSGVLKAFDFGSYAADAARAQKAGMDTAVIRALEKAPATFQEIRGYGDDDGKERGRIFREAVDAELGRHVARPALVACLTAMITDGSLSKKTAGRREVLAPAEAPADDDEVSFS